MLIEHVCPKAKEPVKGEIIGNGVIQKEELDKRQKKNERQPKQSS